MKEFKKSYYYPFSFDSELIDLLARGEGISITFRGKPWAKLVPYEDLKSPKARSELFGIWKDNDIDDVDGYIGKLRKARF